VLRKHLPRLLNDVGSQFSSLPIDLYSGGLNGSYGRIGNFRTNTITWNQGH
jgi:hypothetical protein